jgi:hypothetical protein
MAPISLAPPFQRPTGARDPPPPTPNFATIFPLAPDAKERWKIIRIFRSRAVSGQIRLVEEQLDLLGFRRPRAGPFEFFESHLNSKDFLAGKKSVREAGWGNGEWVVDDLNPLPPDGALPKKICRTVFWEGAYKAHPGLQPFD